MRLLARMYLHPSNLLRSLLSTRKFRTNRGRKAAHHDGDGFRGPESAIVGSRSCYRDQPFRGKLLSTCSPGTTPACAKLYAACTPRLSSFNPSELPTRGDPAYLERAGVPWKPIPTHS